MPQGWIDATEREDKKANREYLACSAACMRALMAKRADEIEHEKENA
jgi:hypothetical protein